MNAVLHPMLALAYAVLIGYGMAVRRRGAPAGLCLALLAVTAALMWDNLVLAAGAWAEAGEGFERVHISRFLLHACVTPLLVPASLAFVRLAGAEWAGRAWAVTAAALLTIGLIALELAVSVARLRLEPVFDHGILTYVPAGRSAAGGWMIAVVMAALLAAGWIVFRRGGPAAPLAASLAMLCGGGLAPLVGVPSLHNLFELALAASLWFALDRMAVRTPRLSRTGG
ncbi:MAG: hypothetical protein A9Z00_01890 [Thermobacillus sp. ZCTH02-B1]|uniref:hypothetical protein n=1 Tax=Thermobacillus sp. ZCTH02-B1 TaxID=1858795 RepID=UPI000B54B66B|nr:hypothetical protein [Thermobacillus sp. ZCTH02-B1]OUM97204.1 MAG: hypothetical protein A9Z00_01890 [Thermobacillus sp. ZCTH02-B1]